MTPLNKLNQTDQTRACLTGATVKDNNMNVTNMIRTVVR